MRILMLKLEGPLQSYGSEAVDARRPVQDVPLASGITGLLANAMGWRRTEQQRLDQLQRRLKFAVRVDDPGVRLRDFHTSQLGANDVMWTTSGRLQERDGGASTYDSPAVSERWYDAGKICTVAVSLTDGNPSIEEVAEAVRRPARPLHLGRKSCLPSEPVFLGIRDAAGLVDALLSEPLEDLLSPTKAERRVLVQTDEDLAGFRSHSVADRKNWFAGVHGGTREVRTSYLPASAFKGRAA